MTQETKSESNGSVYEDEDLIRWVRWGESGKAGSFIQTVCEAALVADIRHYLVLRPALLEFMRQHPMEPPSTHPCLLLFPRK
jgi:hypothetical protein